MQATFFLGSCTPRGFSTFASELAEECGAVELWKNPDLVRPADFCRLSALQAVHQGPLDGLMAVPT